MSELPADAEAQVKAYIEAHPDDDDVMLFALAFLVVHAKATRATSVPPAPPMAPPVAGVSLVEMASSLPAPV